MVTQNHLIERYEHRKQISDFYPGDTKSPG